VDHLLGLMGWRRTQRGLMDTAFANTLALSGDRTLAIEVLFGWMGLLKVSYTPIWLSGRFPAV